MDRQCFKITNTTHSDYLQFCKIMGLNQSDYTNLSVFFDYVLHNKIIKDLKTNSIIVKGE